MNEADLIARRDGIGGGKGFLVKLAASGDLALIVIALVKFAIHLATANRYSYMFDEYYTIALSRHLAGGFVDVPPLVPFITRIWTLAFGTSLFSIRFLAAAVGALTVYLAGRIARTMGAKATGQALVATAALFSPINLAFNSFLAYDGFDQLLLAVFFIFAAKLLKTGDKRLWIAVGIAGGIALMAKYTMLFLGLAFLIGFAASDRRKDFLTPWPWLGGMSAIVIAAPWALWQGFHGWPVIEYWRSYAQSRLQAVNPVEFVAAQFLSSSPFTALLWLIGFAWLLFMKAGKPFRALGFAALAANAIFFLARARFYMTAALYPFLYSAGALAMQGWAERGRRAWIAPAATALIALSGVFLMPSSLPILSPGKTAEFGKGNKRAMSRAKAGAFKGNGLPEHLSLQFGLIEIVDAVARAYEGLTADEKAECMILTNTYGAAGAIDLLGPERGLPAACSGHLSYWLWGYGGKSGKVVITVGYQWFELNSMFEDVKDAGRAADVLYAPWFVRNAQINICRKPLLPMDVLWNTVIKHYD